jgi:pyridinium-3,5-bisthiocarboxylic acid mononucleotide nickel chelatase
VKLLYLDCFSGVAGNMLLGALLGLGYPEGELRNVIQSLGFDPDILHVEPTQVQGLAATLVTVDNPPDQPHRHLADVLEIIDRAEIPPEAADNARKTFTRLAEAEAKVHGTTPDHIHFHEVGAVDALVDIVGVCAAIEALGVEAVICSPLPLGRGTVECAHGTLPVPVPATAELLHGVPTYSAGRDGEHVTPTGAALVTTLSAKFGDHGTIATTHTAFGAGTRKFEGGPPNLLRALLAEAEGSLEELDNLVVETNIDDMNPELFGPLTKALFDAGARDVTLTPCYMKKGRPGVLVSVIAGRQTLDAIAEVLFAQSTTIGLRSYPVSRLVCERTRETMETPFGPVTMKVSRYRGKIVGARPEFEDCRSAAEQFGVPVQDVYDAAIAAYRKAR